MFFERERKYSRRRIRQAVKFGGRKSYNFVQKISIIIGFIASLFFSVVIIYYNLASSIDIDKKTNCPSDISAIKRFHIILIDTTDKIPLITARLIEEDIVKLINRTNKYDKIELYALNGNESDPVRNIFSKCSFGRHDEYNPLTQSPERIMAEKRRKFIEPLKRELDKSINGKEGKETPLLEALSLIYAANRYEDKSKYLYIYSDMMQHTNGLSLYRGVNYERFKQGDYYYSVSIPPRAFRKVYISLFRRKGLARKQRRAVVFWRRYFTDLGILVDIQNF